MCAAPRSRTVIAYRPAFRLRTGRPALVLSAIVKPGPTVPVSLVAGFVAGGEGGGAAGGLPTVNVPRIVLAWGSQT